MTDRITQLGERKNPDSARVHDLRLSVTSSSTRLTENKRQQFSSDPTSDLSGGKLIRAEKGADFEPLLDASEAAKLLRIHPKTLQKLARVGQVPAFRVGRFWRYRASDLEMWLRSASHSDGQLADRVDFTKEKS